MRTGKFPCPICGDPSAYIFWADPTPPAGCPFDEAWHEGSPPTVRNVSECAHQMRKARQRAEWLRAYPEAFDERGYITPAGWAMILSGEPRGTKAVV